MRRRGRAESLSSSSPATRPCSQTWFLSCAVAGTANLARRLRAVVGEEVPPRSARDGPSWPLSSTRGAPLLPASNTTTDMMVVLLCGRWSGSRNGLTCLACLLPGRRTEENLRPSAGSGRTKRRENSTRGGGEKRVVFDGRMPTLDLSFFFHPSTSLHDRRGQTPKSTEAKR